MLWQTFPPWVREARVTWRSRTEVAEKHPQTEEHSTLNINSPVSPPSAPSSTEPGQAGGLSPVSLRQRRRVPGSWLWKCERSMVPGPAGSEGGRPTLSSLGWDWLSLETLRQAAGRTRRGSKDAPGLGVRTGIIRGKAWRSQPGSLGGNPTRQKSEWIWRGSSLLRNRPLWTRNLF